MEAYEHMAGMWLVGEDMPQETNRVTLNRDVTDQHGLPVPNVHFDDHPNDVAMREHAYQPGESVYDAVDAVARQPRAAVPVDAQPGHLPDERATRRTASSTSSGGRTTCPTCSSRDGSVFTTGAAANPTLTIVALAIRQAEHMVGEMKAGSL